MLAARNETRNASPSILSCPAAGPLRFHENRTAARSLTFPSRSRSLVEEKDELVPANDNRLRAEGDGPKKKKKKKKSRTMSASKGGVGETARRLEHTDKKENWGGLERFQPIQAAGNLAAKRTKRLPNRLRSRIVSKCRLRSIEGSLGSCGRRAHNNKSPYSEIDRVFGAADLV